MKSKKIIAFYLPQYHSIPENDKWWGNGFTEWRNVKQARPLYKGHMQPNIPLNNNYYCLLDENVQVWQAELAEKYGVSAFCYYHYWFNGKLLLEKPMENMLKNPNINISYCISWANESWTRSWDGKEKKILIKQKYGGKDDWEKHIEYLIPFFKDHRYLKIENKPIFLIYSTSRIEKCEEMVEYWKQRLVEEGFAGLYIIETLNGVQSSHFLNNSDADIVFEPIYTLTNEIKKRDLYSKIKRFIRSHFSTKEIIKVDGKKAYEIIQKRKYSPKRKTYIGTFTSWDNTPRKGNKGTVFIDINPEDYGKNLKTILKRDDIEDYIFINAWNEWGEGAYLEPDTKYNFKMLEETKRALEENNGVK